MKIIQAFAVLVLLCSCQDDSLPKEILPPKKMQEVFWDYLRADVYTTDFIAVDSTKNAVAENLRLQNIVFKTHKVTKEQFYKSYNYYLDHPAKMNSILDSMMAVQARRQIILNDTTRRKQLKGIPEEKKVSL
ncbi:MAG: DUF4296 domain-containing protein [Ferruginibacter sp.]